MILPKWTAWNESKQVRLSNRLKRWMIIATVLALGCDPLPQNSVGTRETQQPVAQQVAEGPPPKLETPRIRQRDGDLARILDPRADGWSSEDWSDKLTARWASLAKWLTTAATLSVEQASSFVTADFEAGELRPAQLHEVFSAAGLRVQRPNTLVASDLQRRIPATVSYQGIVGFQQSLADLMVNMANPQGRSLKVKVIRIEEQGNRLNATGLYEGSYKHNTESVHQTATLEMVWQIQSNGELRLSRLHAYDFEEVTFDIATSTLYSDCTGSVAGHLDSFRDQLRYGAGHWMQRLEGYLGVRLLESPNGIAVGDVNGDDLDDVYVCQPGGLPNRLWIQQADGTVQDASEESGVDILDYSYSALLVDLDADADSDLAVLAIPGVVLFENDGQGHFTHRTTLEGDYEYSLCAADYDQDGDLDLYACNYFAEASADISLIGRTDPLHDSNNGGRNVLFRNESPWVFRDLTEESGLDIHNRRWSLAASWEDFDNDGNLDLYVANDYGKNVLYRNQGAPDYHFEEVAIQAGTVDANFGMSVSWGDYDRDGHIDLYVSNMFSTAGSRVTSQSQFKQDVAAETRAAYQRLAHGNTLFKNQGDGNFKDVSDLAAVNRGRWAWSSQFVDFNNDSWEDLLVTNGFLTQDYPDDL